MVSASVDAMSEYPPADNEPETDALPPRDIVPPNGQESVIPLSADIVIPPPYDELI
jgi:hypothetical protein